MPGKYSFDNTRDAIRANKISDEERNRMIKGFKSVGGKVLNEKELKLQQHSSSKKRGSRDIIRSSHSNNRFLSDESDSDKLSISSPDSKKKDKERSTQRGLADIFFLKLRCTMKGLTTFSGKHLKNQFAIFLLDDFQNYFN